MGKKMNVNYLSHIIAIGTFVLFIALGLACASAPSSTHPSNEDTWWPYTIPPSRLDVEFGELILWDGDYDNGKTELWVINSRIRGEDEKFYNVKLWQDYGWERSRDGNWKGNAYSISIKQGCLYLNPRYKVAVYIYPDNTYAVFKVIAKKAEL